VAKSGKEWQREGERVCLSLVTCGKSKQRDDLFAPLQFVRVRPAKARASKESTNPRTDTFPQQARFPMGQKGLLSLFLQWPLEMRNEIGPVLLREREEKKRKRERKKNFIGNSKECVWGHKSGTETAKLGDFFLF